MIEKFVAWVIKNRKLVLVLSAILTVFLISQLRFLSIVIDLDEALPQSHPYIIAHNIINKVFGNSYAVVVGITAKDGDVYQPAILEKVKRISDRFTEVPGVVKNNIISLSVRKAKNINGDKDGMTVRPLMEKIPTNALEIQKLKETVRSNPIYENLIVSKDNATTQIVAEIKRMPGGMSPVYNAVHAVVDPERDATVDISIGGGPIFLALIEKYSNQIALLFPLAVLIVGLIHYEAFRTKQALILPLVTALIAVIWAVGGLAIMGQPLDAFNSSTPILILAVAAGHAVQILKRYYEEFSNLKQKFPSMNLQEMNEKAVLNALTKIGPVMVIACMIAAIGFASLVIFEVKTIRVFGIFTAIGILSTLVLELTFIPALRCMLRPPTEKEYLGGEKITFWDKIIDTFYAWTLNKRKQIYFFTFLFIGALSLSSYWLKINNSQKGFFYGKIQERLDDDKLNQRMAGANTFYVLIEGTKDDMIKDPKVLEAMDKTQRFIESQPLVGKTVSIVDFLKKMNQSMNANKTDFYKVPGSSDLVAQYLLLYSSSGEPGDFDSYVDNGYRRAVIQTYLKTDSSAALEGIFKKINTYTATQFGPEVKVSLGGGISGGLALNEVMIKDKILNIIQIMAAVFLISSLIFRSFTAGFLLLLPLIAVVLANFGVMGLLSIPLQISTAMVSAMAVGIGADYGIYMSYRLREELSNNTNEKEAIAKAFRSAGKATLFVSSAMAGGFGVLMFSFGFLVYTYLGLLISIAMLVSSFTALTLFPSLIFTLRPRFIFGDRKGTALNNSGKVAVFLTFIILSTGATKSFAFTAEEIMRKGSLTTKVLDSQSDAAFRLINSSGDQRVRETSGFTKLIPGTTDNMRVTTFNSPSDIKGTKTLLIEHTGKDDDLWIYLPALKKTRRLVSGNKKDSFVGTDFSYGDVIGHKVEEWNHKLVKEENMNGKDCYFIESTPKNKDIVESSGYSKRTNWIDKESFVSVQGEVFDPSGKILKKFMSKDIKKVDTKNNKWQPMHIEVENVQSNHKTVIDFKNFKANTGVQKDIFTARYLEK